MRSTNHESYFSPEWPCPPNVKTAVTMRAGGNSGDPWRGFNLAYHVGDAPEAVTANRDYLSQRLGCKHSIAWLEQVHSNDVIRVDQALQHEADECRSAQGLGRGDALVTSCVDQPIAMMTADCLPVFLVDDLGREVAVVHAGWRGLLNGVLEAAIESFEAPAMRLKAWLGPAICVDCYEVGPEVYESFQGSSREFGAAFIQRKTKSDRKQFDLKKAAAIVLANLEIGSVTDGRLCTSCLGNKFFSYRRDGVTGRMASVIWKTSSSLD